MAIITNKLRLKNIENLLSTIDTVGSVTRNLFAFIGKGINF